MKYSVEIEIDRPRDEVVAAFDNPDNMSKWQEGLLSVEPLEGEPGMPGAKSRLTFQFGKREMVMTETVTVRELPERFCGTYDAPNVHNIVNNSFHEVGPNKTRWVSENEFHFRGVMRLMGLLMRGAFPKQSLKYMQDFKAFVEDGVNVNAKGDSAGEARPADATSESAS